jgi:hypothetical protein
MNCGAAVIVTVIVPVSKMHYDRERVKIRHGYQANHRSYSEMPDEYTNNWWKRIQVVCGQAYQY